MAAVNASFITVSDSRIESALALSSLAFVTVLLFTLLWPCRKRINKFMLPHIQKFTEWIQSKRGGLNSSTINNEQNNRKSSASSSPEASIHIENPDEMLNFGEMLRSNSNPAAVQQHYAHVNKKKKQKNHSNKGRAHKSSSSSDDDENGKAESEVYLKGYQVVQVEAYKPPEPKPAASEEQQYTVLLCASAINKAKNNECDRDYDEIPDETTKQSDDSHNSNVQSTGNVLNSSMDSIVTESIYDVPSSVPRDVETFNQ